MINRVKNTKGLNNVVIKAGIWYVIGNLVMKSINFITMPIFATIFTVNEFGMYNIYWAYVTMISLIIPLALYTSIKNAKYDFKDKLNDYMTSIIFISFVNLIIFLLCGNLCFGIISSFMEFNRAVFNVLIVQSYSMGIITTISAYYSVDYKYKKFLLITFLNSVSGIILSLILMETIFYNNKFWGRVLGGAIPCAIIASMIIYSILKKSRVIKKEYCYYGLRISLPIIPHGISQSILSQFDRILIQKIIGFFEAGIYSFIYNIGLILQVIAISLDNAWTPWFYEKMNRKEYKEIEKKSIIYLDVFFLITVFIITLSPELIKIVAPIEYWSGINLVIPIAISSYFMFLYTLYVQIEYFCKKTQFIAMGTIFAAMINIILNLILIKRFGYKVAAYTTLFSYFILFILHRIIAIKMVGFDIFNIKKIIIRITIILSYSIFVSIYINNVLYRYIMLFIVILISGLQKNNRKIIIQKIHSLSNIGE